MEGNWKAYIFALVLGVAVPWMVCALGGGSLTPAPTCEQIHITVSEEKQTPTIAVLMQEKTQPMPLTEYLTGVILGELPADFAFEAKKAQAVVARTYALRIASGDRHAGAVCTDSGCCQSYRDPAVADDKAVQEARKAVLETEAMVLTYGGKLIDATYFSCSGGVTEDAVAVWGTEIPYLQSVASPGEEHAAHYSDTVSFTFAAFESALQRDLPEDHSQWLGTVNYTDSGSVASMIIGGVSYKGTQLRKLLGLRSTVFEMCMEEDAVVVRTKGFGHRVGMSQYGADAMARTGSDFAQILSHYYQDVQLETDWYELTNP